MAKRLSNKTQGNLMVILQFVFLGLLVFLPGANDWPVPQWLLITTWVFQGGGLLILVVGGINLGKSLTANPVPLEKATLKTTGLYAVVRHPLYLGLLLLAYGIAAGSGSLRKAIYALVLTVLLNYKARFEEKMLLEKYPGYAAYAAKVGRLFPGIGRIR